MRLFKKVRASATPRLKGPGGPARVVPASAAEAGISLWLSSAFPAVGRFAALHPAEAGFTGKPLAGLCSAEFLSGRKSLPDSGKGTKSNFGCFGGEPMGFPAGQREGYQVEFQLFWGRADGIPCRTAGRAPNRISAVLGKRRWASLPDSGKGTKSNFGCFGGEPMGFPARQRERRGVKFRSFWGRTCAIPRLTAGKDPRKRFSWMPILRQRVSPPAGQTFPALRAPVGQGQQKGGPRAALLRGKNYARTL